MPAGIGGTHDKRSNMRRDLDVRYYGIYPDLFSAVLELDTPLTSHSFFIRHHILFFQAQLTHILFSFSPFTFAS